MASLGDLVYRGTSVWKRLVGNTTTTRKFLRQTGTGAASAAPAWDQVAETDLTFTDVTTNNVSTTMHGFAPKLPNIATQYLDGTGAYSVPAGGSASNSFATIAISGQSDVVADSSTDTLTLVAGSGVTLTTNASTDTITIAASGGGATVVRKTATETVNNSATLQNDDHLLFAIGASETWAFEFVLNYVSNTTPDFKWFVKCPASATGWQGAIRLGTTLAFTVDAVSDVTNEVSFERLAGGNGTQNMMLIKGLVVNSTNAGNVQLMWAQNTANASDTQVLINSYLVAHRIS